MATMAPEVAADDPVHCTDRRRLPARTSLHFNY
jgi:hypothetical protein